jgi:transposase
LFPERLDDYIAEDNAVRVIDVFLDSLDLSGSGFGTDPAITGRPACHPATLLRLFIHGHHP